MGKQSFGLLPKGSDGLCFSPWLGADERQVVGLTWGFLSPARGFLLLRRADVTAWWDFHLSGLSGFLLGFEVPSGTTADHETWTPNEGRSGRVDGQF